MKTRRPRRWVWWLVVPVVVIAVGVAVWRMGTGAAIPVRTVAAVEQAPSADPVGKTVLNASGYVTARRRATVASKITGRLVEVRVEEGLPVKNGEVLARLEDAQQQAALELTASQLEAAQRSIKQTEAQLSLARLTLDRTRRLVEADVADAEKLDQDETEEKTLEAKLDVERQQVVVAERELALRRTQLDDTVILAPFDGIVISKDAQAGEMVSPNSAGGGFTRTGICTIVDMNSLEIEVDVNESYISRVRPGQIVEAVLDAYPGWRIPARVITTIPAADRQKATVLVRIGFDELDPRILPEMGIKVAFREREEPEAGAPAVTRRVRIPRDALRNDRGRDVVYVVVDDRVERRAVNVGGSTDGEVIVIAGLRAGEHVIVEGPAALAAGDRVKEDR